MPAATSDESPSSAAESKAQSQTKSTPAKAASTRATARNAKTAAARTETPAAKEKDKVGSVSVTDAAEAHGERPETGGITFTIPLDQAVTVATTVARIPLNVARKVAPSRVNGMKGIPVYLGIGGLTAVGLVEWPVAAAAGAGYAALRRWGPLKPDQDA